VMFLFEIVISQGGEYVKTYILACNQYQIIICILCHMDYYCYVFCVGSCVIKNEYQSILSFYNLILTTALN
jgi:hypothetical protein